jgi:sulfoxide reductase heme-binding subunit YedZ
MESTSAYIIAALIALSMLLIAVIVANAIRFQGGSRPRDPKKRKTWFWILAFANPAMIYLLGYFVFRPDANIMIVNNYITALSIGTVAGFLIYLVAGFILSKVFRNGKLGHWF